MFDTASTVSVADQAIRVCNVSPWLCSTRRLYRGEQFAQGSIDFHADSAPGLHHFHSVGWLFFQVGLCGALQAGLAQSCFDMI